MAEPRLPRRTLILAVRFVAIVVWLVVGVGLFPLFGFSVPLGTVLAVAYVSSTGLALFGIRRAQAEPAPQFQPVVRTGSGEVRNGMFALKVFVALVWLVLLVTFVMQVRLVSVH